jgi:hypothetical protein
MGEVNVSNPREKACPECDTISEVCFLKPDENLQKLNVETDEIRRQNVWRFYDQAKQEVDTITAQVLYMKVIMERLKPKIDACLGDRTKNEAVVNDIGNLLNCHYLIFQANNNALGPLVASGGRHEESSTLHKLVKWIREQG